MKRFKQFINEETNPTALTKQGVIDIRDSAVRDNVNALLNAVTSGKFVTPYIALERVGKVLANFHIFLPKYSFMEGDSGMATFEVNQFGLKMGMTDDGRVVTADDEDKYSIFFEYRMSDSGMFNVFCELVDEEELDDLLADIEDELNDEEDEDKEEEQIDEAVNAKKIAADHDAGHSADVIVQKHLNKKGDNKDEILKAIRAHLWNKRMNKKTN